MIYALLLSLASPTWAVGTNVYALREAVIDALGEMKFPPSGDTVEVEPEGEDEGNWFVEAVLEEFLTGKGYRVAADTSFRGPVLSFRVLRLKISCRKVGLLGRYVEREAEVELSLRWTEEGRVLSLGNFEGRYSDRFPTSLLPELAHNRTPPFEADVMGRDWSRLAEPFVVSAVVGGLLYIFYSAR